MSEWAAQSNRHVAWVALDATDNDPAQFWAYMTAALRQLHAGISDAVWDLFSAGRGQLDHACVVSLLNELEVFDDDVVLVLDDYEAIQSENVHEGVRLFIKHLPHGLHLVLVSRTDPPLSLPQLRARGWLSELRAADLAFTREETEQFLDRPEVPSLHPVELAILQGRTQGWPAALELAVLALR
ncbi:MAG: helix-turn-helix transcriptional regulator, partial [Actinobacteria bacterium]|nr:helix-turn-helix transcriptional regulator [Actinomycetota bacterium]